MKLSLDVAPEYSAKRLMPNFVGPDLILLDYSTLKPAKALPHQDPLAVIAYAVPPEPKAPWYKSDFMDGPLLEHLDWYKSSGEDRFGLDYRTYQVVEVAGYPHEELYLKRQTYHDFFMHCGLEAVPANDLCTIGFEATIPGGRGESSSKANIYIKINKNEKARWREIEDNVGRFVLDHIKLG